MAAGDGVVLRAGRAGGYGNLIELRHRNGITTRYGHLRGFARGIRAGARVEQGQTIGYVGSTGLASGPHLHYEFRVNGVAKDSRRVELGNGAPIRDADPRRLPARARPPAGCCCTAGADGAVASAPSHGSRPKPRPGGSRSAPVVDLFPAIDIRHGRVVRLSQGEATRQTVYGDDPVAVAERFVDAGRALDPRGGSRPRVRRRRQPGAGAPHRGRGRRAGARPARRRASDASTLRARGAGPGRDPRRHRHGRGVDPGVRARRARRRGRGRGSPWASTRGTGRSRSAGGPRPPTLTAEALARRVAGEGVAHRRSTPTSRATGCSPAPTSTARAGCRHAGVGVIASGGIAGARRHPGGARGGPRRRDRRAARCTRAGSTWPRRSRPPRRRPSMILRAVVVLALAAAPGRVHLPPARADRAPRLGAARLPRRRLGRARPPAPQRQLSGRGRAARRPLVLLDASLSLAAPGGRWREARDSAARWGEVRRFGDERGSRRHAPDPRPLAARARAHSRPSASDRPVVVVTDGEIEDAARHLRPTCSPRSACGSFPAQPSADLALTRVSGPARVTAGDSIPLELEVEAIGGAPRPTASRSRRCSAGSGVGVRTARASRNGSARGRLAVELRARSVPASTCFACALAGTRTTRSRAPTRGFTSSPWRRRPGVVLLAAPADWDSRFLYRTLREVAQLPVRGFVRARRRALALDGRSLARAAASRCARRRGAPIC